MVTQGKCVEYKLNRRTDAIVLYTYCFGKYDGKAMFQIMAANIRTEKMTRAAHHSFFSHGWTSRFRSTLIPTSRPAIAPARCAAYPICKRKVQLS